MKNSFDFQVLGKIPYHLHTIWLFTHSDALPVTSTVTLFAISSALASSIFDRESLPMTFVLGRVPIIAFWMWNMILPFTIGNQRSPAAIEQDKINKPWRPLPSNRIQPEQADTLLLLSYALSICVGYFLGGFWQSVALAGLDYWYNDLAGGDRNWFVRNFVNACAFSCYNSGALEIAIGATSTTAFNSTAWKWLLMTGTIVLSTIHTQDLQDQVGDAQTGRSTIPVILGDKIARWVTAIPIAFWGYAACTFWELDIVRCFPLLIVNAVLVYRILCKRTVSDDEVTWKVWNGWMWTVYLLPLIKSL